jgi:O-antigen ligase
MLQQRTMVPMETPREGRFHLLPAQFLAGLGSIALVLAWLTPNHYLPWTGFHGDAVAFAALCSFVFARALAPPPAPMGRATPVCFGLVLLITAQWVAGLIAYGGDALLSGLYIIGIGLAWWLGENTQHDNDRADTLSWLAALFVAGAVASIFVAMLQWLRMEQTLGIFATDRQPGTRPGGNLGQPNHLSLFCLMATVFAIWLYERAKLHRWQFVLLLLWFAFGLTLTESRAGLLGAAVVGLALLLRRRDFKRTAAPLAVAFWWGALLLAFVLWPALNEALYLQGPRSGEFTQDSARLVMWRQCIAAIADAPWFGYGWRQTMFAQKQAAALVPGWLATDYAHNFMLDLILWVGVPLGTIFLLAGAWWIVRAWLRLADARQVILAVACIPFLVHSLAEFPFAYAYFLFPVAWLLGALQALQLSPPPDQATSRARRDSRPLVLGIATIFVGLGVAAAVEYLQAEEDYRVMRFELRRVGKTPQGYASPRLVLLTQLDATLQLGRLVPYVGMPEQDIQRLGIASARQGWATLDLSYAVALGLNGRPVEAARQLALLRSVYGEESSRQAFDFFREARESHPELNAVVLP